MRSVGELLSSTLIPSTSRVPSLRWERSRWVKGMEWWTRKAIPPPGRPTRSFLMRV